MRAKDVYSVLYPDSTKDADEPLMGPMTGQFGTGFTGTHVLSAVIQDLVETLFNDGSESCTTHKDGTTSSYTPITFTIDRTHGNERRPYTQLRQAMATAEKDFELTCKAPARVAYDPEHALQTCFTYDRHIALPGLAQEVAPTGDDAGTPLQVLLGMSWRTAPNTQTSEGYQHRFKLRRVSSGTKNTSARWSRPLHRQSVITGLAENLHVHVC